MKIIQLNLLAFGHFTDTHIDLSNGEEGFHIIYGPNEAGKSSALRALQGRTIKADELNKSIQMHRDKLNQCLESTKDEN